MRAALYARFSTDMQNPKSAADQLAACRRHADRLGFTVALEFFDEGISGTALGNRPGAQELLAAADEGRFDVVVTEHMDRLSRGGADTWSVYLDLKGLGIPIETLDQGRMTTALAGTSALVSALRIEDDGKKTRRGLDAVVRDGRSAGGISYGYRKVMAYDGAGEPVRGLREIDPAEAAVVCRIFRAYAAGDSPRSIAGILNAEAIPSPRGGKWNASTINGNAARGNGVLHNALYVGEVIWGRQAWRKDRHSGKRRSRPGPEVDQVRMEAPELRIVPQELWDRVHELIAANALGPHQRPEGRRRPVRLLSGLIRCSCCRSPMVISGPNGLLRCSVNREKGAAVCDNGRTALSEQLEARVLTAVRDNLLHPEVIEAAVREVHAELKRRKGAQRQRRAVLEAELREVKAKTTRLVDHLADGLVSGTAIRDRLVALEQRQAVLEVELEAEPTADVVDMHPGAATQYRRWVEDLQAGLLGEPILERREAQQAFRNLVTAVWFIPGKIRGQYDLELETEMAALLRISPEKDGHAGITTLGAGTRNGRSDKVSLPWKLTA